jgi:hypothetical protein
MQPLSRFLLMVWDGIHIIGEVFGLTLRKADQFADSIWLVLMCGLLLWTVFMTAVTR